MTAVSWDDYGWDDEEQEEQPEQTFDSPAAVPDFYCTDPSCCPTPSRPPGLLTRLRAALRRRPPEGTTG